MERIEFGWFGTFQNMCCRHVLLSLWCRFEMENSGIATSSAGDPAVPRVSHGSCAVLKPLTQFLPLWSISHRLQELVTLPRISASRELGCRFGFYEEVYIYILNTSKHRSKAADTFPQEHLLPNICGLEFSSPISTYFKKLSTSQWSHPSGKWMTLQP